MNVKNLIEILKSLDENAEVIIHSSNFELRNAKVPVTFVHQYDTGSNKDQTFRDAFDGETYSKKTWEIFGGKTPVVMIQ